MRDSEICHYNGWAKRGVCDSGPDELRRNILNGEWVEKHSRVYHSRFRIEGDCAGVKIQESRRSCLTVQNVSVALFWTLHMLTIGESKGSRGGGCMDIKR
jgi:hypothetical protein